MYEIYNDLKFVGYHYHIVDGKRQFDYRYLRRAICAVFITVIAWMANVRLNVTFSPIVSGYVVMTIMNVLNGFRPWHFHYSRFEKLPKWCNYIIEKTIYGYKTSLQYLLIWDVIGAIVGGLIVVIFGL